MLVAGINLTQASNTTCRFASIEESPLATTLVVSRPGTLLPLERMPDGTPSPSLGRAGYDGTSYDGAAWDAIAAIAPCHEPSTDAHSAAAAGPGGGACPVPQDGSGVVVRCFSPAASLQTCDAPRSSIRCVDKPNVSAVLELAMIPNPNPNPNPNPDPNPDPNPNRSPNPNACQGRARCHR